jgi:uncharacterized protein (TIGR00156 family)
MKKRLVFCGYCLAALFLAAGVYAQEGFTGPGPDGERTITVKQAAALADDTRVVLTGTIVRSLGDEKYIFNDATGEITIEIDRKVWRGLSVGESDRVEISGKVDKDFLKTEIEVKKIRKL